MRKGTPQERYDSKNTVRIALKLNKKYDADIISYLESTGNKQGTVKEALREKIQREEEAGTKEVEKDEKQRKL